MRRRPTDAPQRVISTAADMLATYGLNATSIREVTKRAEAPFGSTYHHFPGGKQQVLAEATALAGSRIDAMLDEVLREGVVSGVARFLALWRERLLKSDFHVGCPVLAAAVEEPIDGGAEAAGVAFTAWERRLAEAFIGEGHAPVQAQALATMLIASVEGAVAISRATRDIAAFDRVVERLEGLLR
jgi:AcrR family transcriptional regulator